jgi:DNA-binding MltR family transcriptional regulator
MSKPFDQFDEIMELRGALSAETDRGCALHAASYLDNELGVMLAAYFIDDKKAAAELLDGTGGLATFSARIAIAFALGLISNNARKDLTLIRKIRNDFGHNPQQIGFDYEPIANRCRELYYRWDAIDRPPRRFFENSVFALAAQIHGAKWHSKRPVPPKEIIIDDTRRKKHMDFVERLVAAMIDQDQP